METIEQLQDMLLEREIKNFYYREADLLDDRDFDGWLDLFTEDVRYWMPLAYNAQFRRGNEYSREGVDSAWIDEDKTTLRQRVKQLATGIHWAEEPRSRISHLITNVRVLDVEQGPAGPAELKARCRFLVYRNRMESEVDILVGKRTDTLRRGESGWQVARREIYLDQNVLLAKSLTTFF